MVIGITGGIATGKSTVTRMLQDRGAITFSADEAARAVLYKGGPAYRTIVGRFSADVLLPDGEIDRQQLAQIIFADPEARTELNRITHPLIRRLLSDQIQSALDDFPPPAIIAVEIPLLYEGNLQSWFEQIIVVTTSKNVQMERLMERSKLSLADAATRIAAQIPLELKAAAATHVVANDGCVADLTPRVDALWQELNSSRTGN